MIILKPYLITLLTFIITFFTVRCDRSEDQIANTDPNILLILTDDMGFGDVTGSGNTIINTPNIDGLAESSVHFNYFYVSPVCAPTRASLLTGRYHQRTGVRSVTNGFETMDPDEITLAELLKENGYRTGIFGKWHLGEYYPSVPNAQGFDEFLGFRTGHTSQYFDATLEHNGKSLKTRGHITDVLTNEALNFMTSNHKDPFFCYLAYNAPHTPLQIDSSWIHRYSDLGLDERTARVYGMIEHLDQGVGKILDTLKSRQLLDNTMVIFMSDNGPINGWQVPQSEMRYNVGLRDQKFTVYEGGIRTQCYWMWKGHWEKGTETNEIAAHIDVLPTLMDVLGIDVPGTIELDGQSLKPFLKNPTKKPSDRILFQKYALKTLTEPAPFPGGIARQGPWKMVNGTELYRLDEDPGESNNVAEYHPDVLDKLTTAYLTWYRNIASERDLQSMVIEVGHKQENPVRLQPHHGMAFGGVKFKGFRGLVGEKTGFHPKGVDSDWLSNWHSQKDSVVWNVHITTPGRYRFSAEVRDNNTVDLVDIRVEVNNQSINAQITKEYLTTNWNTFNIGVLQIASGACSISLALTDDLESKNFEIKELVIRKL